VQTATDIRYVYPEWGATIFSDLHPFYMPRVPALASRPDYNLIAIIGASSLQAASAYPEV
jgi:hypothetical protein